LTQLDFRSDPRSSSADHQTGNLSPLVKIRHRRAAVADRKIGAYTLLAVV